MREPRRAPRDSVIFRSQSECFPWLCRKNTYYLFRGSLNQRAWSQLSFCWRSIGNGVKNPELGLMVLARWPQANSLIFLSFSFISYKIIIIIFYLPHSAEISSALMLTEVHYKLRRTVHCQFFPNGSIFLWEKLACFRTPANKILIDILYN